MTLQDVFPVWKELSASQQQQLQARTHQRTLTAGTHLDTGQEECLGFVIVTHGRLRAYMHSAEGKELTLYRLLPHDMCLLSASCVLHGLRIDIALEAEENTTLLVIPTDVYKVLMDESLAVSTMTNRLMSERLSEVMWLIEQVMWHSFDKRLANFLLEESNLAGTTTLHITHDKIAAHLGSAREVVTRMLRYFQNEGWVQLSRGVVTLTEPAALEQLLT